MTHAPTNIPPARRDSVEGLAPSASTQRLLGFLLIAALALIGAGLIAAATVLCAIAGYGIELVVGGIIALVGTAPVLLAVLSRNDQPVAVPARAH